MKKFTLGFVLFFAIAVFVGGGQVHAQATSAEVSSSYQVTVKPVSFFERIKLVFTFDAEKKAQVLQDFSSRNFALANLKLEEGKTEEAGKLFLKSDNYISKASVATSKIRNEEKQKAIQNNISVTTSNRIEALTEAKARIENPVAKEALDRAIIRQQVSINASITQDGSANQNAGTRGGNGTALGGGIGISAVNSACTPTTTPYIKVLSPNGGEEYVAGQEVTVTWQSCNNPHTPKKVAVRLSNGNGGYTYYLSGDNAMNVGSPDTGSLTANLPPENHTSLNSGSPVNFETGSNFRIEVFMYPVEWDQYSDSSDNLFTINGSSAEVSQNESVCSLNVQAGQTISLPFTITGQAAVGQGVDLEACPLNIVFEGQIGGVNVYSTSGTYLNSWAPLMVQDFEYQPGTYNFSGTLNTSGAVSAGQNVILRFTKEDPTGALPVSFDIPVVVQ